MVSDEFTHIYFMHIKKCAGTSLVGLARRQKEALRLPASHANAIPAHPKELNLKGDARWIRFWEWPMDKQRTFIDGLNCDFFANEGHIDENFVRLEGMFYLIVLRHGVDRFVSHFRHVRRIRGLTDGLSDVVENSGAWRNMMNYATYQLTGRKVVGYDEEAVAIAQSNLDRFDHIVFSESYNDDVQYLIDRFGWTRPEVLPKRNTAESEDGVLEDLTPRIHAKLAELNASDMAIFEYAMRNRALS